MPGTLRLKTTGRPEGMAEHFRIEREGGFGLAISLEEDDARIYVDYADRLKADFPNTAKLLTTMQHEELVHAQRLIR